MLFSVCRLRGQALARAVLCFGTLVVAATLFGCRDLVSPLDPGTMGARRYLSASGTVVVSQDSMRGWGFYDDQASALCTNTTSCRLVAGPSGQTFGAGSAELATATSAEGVALILQDYKGTRFQNITELRYSTYRQSANAGNNLAVALQLNVDYDLSDSQNGYQGRLVFEPYQGASGSVVQATWQRWDARAGKWWGTRASVPRSGATVANPCTQSSPCTWSQLLAEFPNVGIHTTYGAVVLKAGSNWAGFRGNVDNLSIGVAGLITTFDFEVQPSPVASDFRPENVTIAADCGKRFRLTSANSVGATLTVRIEGQSDSSFVFVPPRPHPDSVAVASFNVASAGIARLTLDSTLIARVATAATACASYELGYIAAPGVTAITRVAPDSLYAPGSPVTYSFVVDPGYEHLTVVVDDTIASSSGTITMNADHVLLVGADPIITPGPRVVAIGSQMRAVLASASPGDAYANLLTSMLREAEATDAATVAAQIDTAMFLYIDPVADSAALRRFDDDAGGSSFEYEENNGTSGVYRLTPDNYAFYNKAAKSAAQTSKSRISMRRANASASSTATGPAPAPAGTPDEDTRIIFVNGVFNSYGDALKSFILLRNLARSTPRFGRGSELYSNVTAALFYNRSHLSSLDDACRKRAWQEFEYRHSQSIQVKFANCKAELYNRTLVEQDLIEAWGQKQRLRANGAPELATSDALRLARYIATITHRDLGAHAIVVGHSQGNLMIAEAMPRLRQIEGHDLNVGNRCTAALTLAAPAVRADMRFEGSEAYLRGYTIPGDILLYAGLRNDFPRLTTPEATELLAYRNPSFPGGGFIGAIHRIKVGKRIHEVRNYLDPAVNGRYTNSALEDLHDECVAGSIAVSPSALSMPYLGTVALGTTVYNRNGNVLVQRSIDGGQIGAKAVYNPTTALVTGVAPTFGTTSGQVLTTNTRRVFAPVTLNVGSVSFTPFYTEAHGGYWERDSERVTGSLPSLEPTTPPNWSAAIDCPTTNRITITRANGDYWDGHQLCYQTFEIVTGASAYPGIARLSLSFDNGSQPWDSFEHGYDVDGNCRGNCRPAARSIAIWYNSFDQVVKADTLVWTGGSSYRAPVGGAGVLSSRAAKPSTASVVAGARAATPR